MYLYKGGLPIKIENIKPDPIFFHELHSTIGTFQGLSQIVTIMKNTLVIRDRHVCDTFAMIVARELTNVEALGELMQGLLGIDASYVDCIDLNNPVYERIGGEEEHSIQEADIKNDVCAMILQQVKFDEELKAKFMNLKKKTKDQVVISILEWLCVGKDINLEQWNALLERVTYPIKHKDFGEGYLSEQANALDSGNYFDRPNPYFINPDKY